MSSTPPRTTTTHPPGGSLSSATPAGTTIRFDEGRLHRINYSALHRIGDETAYKHYRAPNLASTKWSEGLRCLFLVPITGATGNSGEKQLYGRVPIATGIAGQTKDGFLLCTQGDTFHESDLQRPGVYQRNPHVLPHDILDEARRQIARYILLSPSDARRPPRLHPVSRSCSLGPGTIVELRDGPATVSQAVVVANDHYLRLIASANSLSHNLKGVMRGLLPVVPILPGPPDEDDFPVHRPDGSFVAFYRINFRSLTRLLRPVGQLESNLLAETADGMAFFLGLENL